MAVAKVLTAREMQALLASPKDFLGKPENVQKVLGADLASRKALKEQIAQRMGVDAKELTLKMAGGGPQEYYAVTSVVRFRSAVGDPAVQARQATKAKARR
jgi:hypothetical protein